MFARAQGAQNGVLDDGVKLRSSVYMRAAAAQGRELSE
jgi:hypothetical protein